MKLRIVRAVTSFEPFNSFQIFDDRLNFCRWLRNSGWPKLFPIWRVN